MKNFGVYVSRLSILNLHKKESDRNKYLISSMYSRVDNIALFLLNIFI